MELKVFKKKIRISPMLIILFAVLALYVLSMVGIFFWGIITSFKNTYVEFKLYENKTYALPTEWKFDAYITAFNIISLPGPNGNIGFWQVLWNSILYAIGCAFFKTLVPCITAYACARFDTKLSKIVYNIILITMIVPIVGSLPSELKIAYALKFTDKIWGLWIMSASMQGLYFFVMYSAFKAMPMGYSEAAKIDGANNLDVLLRIAMPLIKNLFLTVLLINFVQFWNNYQTPKVYLPTHGTLGYAMFYYGRSSNELKANGVEGVIALALIVAAPVLVLFMIFQERLMGNLTLGGLKG